MSTMRLPSLGNAWRIIPIPAPSLLISTLPTSIPIFIFLLAQGKWVVNMYFELV
jgi:hypothetical protein